MANKTKGSDRRGRVRHQTPVTVTRTVDSLPPRQAATAMDGVIDSVIEAGGNWVELDPGGRQPGSVQSMIASHAERRKVNVESAVRGETVFARYVPGEESGAETAEE